jgi:hypothetical protein
MKLVVPVAIAILLVFLSPIDVGAQKGWKTETIPDEFSFQYPSNWKLQERENRFTTTDAKLNYGNNHVQMFFEGSNISDLGSPTDDYLLNKLKDYIELKKDGKVFESGLDKNAINNRTTPYVIGTYETQPLLGTSLNMVMLVTAVHVNDNELVLARYIAEQNDFDKYLPKVKQVIKSISPLGNNAQEIS